MASDLDFMRLALLEAEIAFKEEEVPVGAVLVINNEVIARDHNRRESTFDPSAHAEMLVLRAAAKNIKNWRLDKATLYVTKEPCIMCAGAMINARLNRLVYGCEDVNAGAVDNIYKILYDRRLNHQVSVVSGIMQDECASILKRFFQLQRSGV